MSSSVLIWQQKGGVGKTTIACELITRLKYLPITNEGNSSLFDFFEEIENQKLLNETSNPVITMSGDIPEDEALKEGCVFDFGGYVDKRLIDAIKYSKFIVMPMTPRTADADMFFKSFEALKEVIKKLDKKADKKIVVILNMIEKSHEKYIDIIKTGIISTLTGAGFKDRYKIFEIPKTEGLNNIFLERKPIIRIIETKRHLKRHFEPIANTFDEIVKFITK
jgi:cellulose biosynthesis protein BcsQ